LKVTELEREGWQMTDRERLEVLCRFVNQEFDAGQLAAEFPDVSEILRSVIPCDYDAAMRFSSTSQTSDL
jgi:hypothetical protein